MIVFIGAHGTGKSTLLEALKEERPDIYCSDGWGRPVKEIGEKLGLNMWQQQVIINTLQEHRWEKDVVQSNFACTRSIIDEWVYCEAFGMDELSKDRKEIFSNSDYKKAKYFYIPIEFELEEDGTRYTGKEFQKIVDGLMKKWIEEFKLPIVTLKGNTEQRLQTLLKNL